MYAPSSSVRPPPRLSMMVRMPSVLSPRMRRSEPLLMMLVVRPSEFTCRPQTLRLLKMNPAMVTSSMNNFFPATTPVPTLL